MIDAPARAALLHTLTRASGALTMMALDARIPMIEIFRSAGRLGGTTEISEFKTRAARELGGHVSAVLCDLESGAEAAQVVRDEMPATGLIVAVDSFPETAPGSVPRTTFDDAQADAAAEFGRVSALKLYVYWSPDEDSRRHREREVGRFVARCAQLELLALVEGVSTLPLGHPEFDRGLVIGAQELGDLGPDIYKTQVPSLGTGERSRIADVAAEITLALGDLPWVVLSKGVSASSFSDSVQACCEGGAAGFLAGRALWSRAVAADDVGTALREQCDYARELCVAVERGRADRAQRL